MTTTAYGYDSQTGRYTGPYRRHIDPEETRIAGHNVYLSGPYLTIEPPTCAEYGGVRVNETLTRWEAVPDYSAAAVYAKATGERAESPAFGEPLPDDLTLSAPPEKPSVGQHQIAIWDGEKYDWEIKPDWRDVALYDTATGKKISIDEIGQAPADVGATELAPPSAYHVFQGGKWAITSEGAGKKLADEKAAMWQKIKAERERRTTEGGYKVGSKWFQSDSFSRNQQMGLFMLGANLPAGVQWKTMDGSFVTMSPQLAGQILAAAAASDIAIFAAAETHKAAMEASEGPLDYDYLTGWPPIYGE